MEKEKIDRENDFVFKEYKKYKKKKPLPDFSEVIDFQDPEKYGEGLLKKIDVKPHDVDFSFCQIGLKDPKEWKVYELLTCPGFLVVVNPFATAGAQSHWVKRALTSYTKKPYPSNLDILMKLDNEHKSLWEISHEESQDNSFINKLRWVHMGYHFDYNVVDYKAKQYFGFPNDLAQLTETIASVFKFDNYNAETGIINYYPEGASMGGHTDHYEEELRQPLISYSFGQSAVYLIGGPTRDVKPKAIWVRSGDIMLMTGPSRVAFHAVPCIITKPSKTTPQNIDDCSLVSDFFTTDDGVCCNKDCCKHDGVCCNKDCCKHVWKNDGVCCNKDCCKHDGVCCNKDCCKHDGVCCNKDCCKHVWKNDGVCCNKDCCKHDGVCCNKDCCKHDGVCCKHVWKNEMLDESWNDFSKYLSSTRININIRQVHKHKGTSDES